MLLVCCLDPRQTDSFISFEGICVHVYGCRRSGTVNGLLATFLLQLVACRQQLDVMAPGVKQLCGTLPKGGQTAAAHTSSAQHLLQQQRHSHASVAQLRMLRLGTGGCSCKPPDARAGGFAHTLAALWGAALQSCPVSRGIGRNPRLDIPCGVGGVHCVGGGGVTCPVLQRCGDMHGCNGG